MTDRVSNEPKGARELSVFSVPVVEEEKKRGSFLRVFISLLQLPACRHRLAGATDCFPSRLVVGRRSPAPVVFVRILVFRRHRTPTSNQPGVVVAPPVVPNRGILRNQRGSQCPQANAGRWRSASRMSCHFFL
uniref:Uncharacterized protein n=1 Tax=Panagrellus redivivus TaxID=6233 RepID=A0A7E4ZUX9_PANRE